MRGIVWNRVMVDIVNVIARHSAINMDVISLIGPNYVLVNLKTLAVKIQCYSGRWVSVAESVRDCLGVMYPIVMNTGT